MNGFLMSLGGYISHRRCCTGEFGLVTETVFLMAMRFQLKTKNAKWKSYFSRRLKIFHAQENYFFLENAASNAAAFGVKSSLRTNAQLSVAPWTRSMRPSSHSTDSGPR